jgi:hypothetical protein
MRFHGSVVASAGGDPQLVLGYLGSDALILHDAFSGTLIAPQASVDVDGDATFRGVLIARDIAVDPGASVAFVAAPAFP